MAVPSHGFWKSRLQTLQVSTTGSVTTTMRTSRLFILCDLGWLCYSEVPAATPMPFLSCGLQLDVVTYINHHCTSTGASAVELCLT